jgi:hypothetical protein
VGKANVGEAIGVDESLGDSALVGAGVGETAGLGDAGVVGEGVGVGVVIKLAQR